MDVDDFLFELDEMLEDERFSFADSTLRGIRSTVNGTRVVTEGQLRAVKNIKASKGELDEKSGPNWKRRYEGR